MRSKEAIEDNKALIAEFPFLLPRNRWTGTVPDDYDYSYTELDALPDGWRIAFGIQMCRELKKILIKGGGLDTYRITQIKEKFGTLRWYDNGCPGSVSNAYYAWLKKYAELSRRTCIICGDKAAKKSVGYVTFYCEECASKWSYGYFKDIKN